MGFAHLTMPGQFCWRSARGSAGRCPSTFCPLSSPAPILLRWCARPAVWDFLPLCFPTVADLFQAAFQASICLSFCSLGTGHNRCFVASTSALNLGCEGEGGVEEGGGGRKRKSKHKGGSLKFPHACRLGDWLPYPHKKQTMGVQPLAQREDGWREGHFLSAPSSSECMKADFPPFIYFAFSAFLFWGEKKQTCV